MPLSGFLLFTVVLAVVAVLFAWQSIKVVPQQTAWVVERLGKFHAVLNPGLNFIIPFIDRVAYRHSLKEIPLDTPSQVCITRDNTQLTVDGGDERLGRAALFDEPKRDISELESAALCHGRRCII